jgi:three-Cys-motif partner protein
MTVRLLGETFSRNSQKRSGRVFATVSQNTTTREIQVVNKRLVINSAPEADPLPNLVVDHGKNNDGVGQWVAQEKHRYLSTYIDAARAAAKSRFFSEWVFIDPFCGPGRMRQRNETITRPGGSVVAWRQSQASGTPFGKVFIGDIDPQRSAACEARLRALGAPVQRFDGPASETVLEMVKLVPARALCLVYIDPYNLALLSYPMIEALARLPKVDFVVHFSTMDLIRNVAAELDPDRARFDEVSPGWRERMSGVANQSLAVAFFDDWHKKVKALNFEFSKAMPLIMNDDQREIYRLVFFARNDLPIRLWADVARDPNRGLFD